MGFLAKLVVYPVVAVFAFAFLKALAGGGSGGGGTSARPPRPSVTGEPAIRTTVKQIQRDYGVNEVAADDKYKGKVVRLSGSVSDISKGGLGGIHVNINGIDCEGQVQPEVAGKLRRGDDVDIQGVGAGLLLGTVILRDCWIAAAPSR